MRRALLSILCGTFLVSMDQTIVATVLPVIVRDLGGTTWYAWVAASYILTNTVALPIAGRLSETRQPRSVYFWSMALFLAGSALCALARTMPELVVARAVQGLGGGAMVASGSTILGLLFPPRERGKYFGYFGAVIGLASLAGPLLGGILADTLSWRSVFLINLPPGLLSLAFVWSALPREAASSGRFDPGGALTLILWSVPLMLGFLSGQWWMFLIAVVGLVWFVRVERRTADPLLELSLLADPAITWSCLALLCVASFFTGTVLFLPLYLVEVRGFSATQAGLSMLPATLGAIFSAIVVGRLLEKLGRYRAVVLVANALALVLLLLSWWVFSPTASLWVLLGTLGLLGMAFGLLMPIYPLAAQNAVDKARLGTASSLVQFAREIGSTVATALMGGLMIAGLHAELPRYLPAGFGVTAFQDEKALRAELQAEVAELRRQVAAGDTRALEANPLVPRPVPSTPEQWRALEDSLDSEIVAAMDATLTAAIRQVYLAAAVCAGLAFLASLMLPNAELKGKEPA